jgi:single-stranded-DNA-specific exonuclease
LVWWGGGGWPLPKGRFDLAYTLRVNSFRGQRELQVQWVDTRPIEVASPEVETDKARIEVIDHRTELHPLAVLQQLMARGDIQVWAEAEAREKLNGRDRNELMPTSSLAIWTPPPEWPVLHDALRQVSPGRVHLFAVDPGTDQPDTFLKRLAGLVKHVINTRAGRTGIPALAAATAQTNGAVQLGLAWLAGRGMIQIVQQDETNLYIEEGAGKQVDVSEITTALKNTLLETAAYRRHYARADGDRLINE